MKELSEMLTKCVQNSDQIIALILAREKLTRIEFFSFILQNAGMCIN